MLKEAAQLAHVINTGMRLVQAGQRAVEGDKDALGYLLQDGIHEAADLYHPGVSRLTRTLARNVADYRAGQGAVEGEYRILDDGPSQTSREAAAVFGRAVAAATWGTFCFLGPKGSGKTTGAMRLAELWSQRLDWPVLVVNAYPEDRYPFVQPVTARAFVAELREIVALLNAPAEEGEDLDAHSDRILTSLEPYRYRVVVIDEMSLTVGPSGGDAGRVLVRQIMAQARHLSWLIVYVGQLARMLPRDLLNCEAVFVKKPSGIEAEVDIREPIVQQLWQAAVEDFRKLHTDPWYAGCPYPRKGWTYAFSQGINGRGRYRGLMYLHSPGRILPGDGDAA